MAMPRALLGLLPIVAACGLSLSAPSGLDDATPPGKSDAGLPVADAGDAGLPVLEDAASDASGVIVPADFTVGNGKDGGYTAAASGAWTFAHPVPLGARALKGSTSLEITMALDPAYQVGDLILLHSAYDPAETRLPTDGDVDLSKHAFGKYALMEITAIAPTSTGVQVVIKGKDGKGLPFDFPAPGTQVLRVPQFSTVNIPASITLSAPKWDGLTGGVIAFMSKGTALVDGTLDASGAGFRGGARDPAGTGATCPSGDGSPTVGYAPKGEGPFRMYYGAAALGGTGSYGSAGGGGNCAFGGGGGGGAFGKGGEGGGIDPASKGQGGNLHKYDDMARDKSTQGEVQFGAGGGAGEAAAFAGSPGGNGGGLLFVRAQAVAGAGTWLARGESPAAAPSGGSGGGGGGYIDVRVKTTLACTLASVSGGNGGEALAATGIVGNSGGGGGGGGIVVLGATAPNRNCPTDVTSGSVGAPANGANRGSAGADYFPGALR